MAKLSEVEKRQLEALLGMGDGYVMDFNNADFADFFTNTVGVNIYDEKYDIHGGSKAKRMRAFWNQESEPIVGKILNEMLKVWKYQNDGKQDDPRYQSCKKIVARLLGKKSEDDLPDTMNSEEEFLKEEFGSLSFDKLPIDTQIIPIIQSRYEEAYHCLKSKAAPLSVVFLCGSILEGILLGTAMENPSKFREANNTPQKTLPVVKWKLVDLINVAYHLKLLGEDVKKHSHALRYFRNYIHPYEQMMSQFKPDQHTAKICMQVLRAAVADLSGERSSSKP